jgi:hypothetical protein
MATRDAKGGGQVSRYFVENQRLRGRNYLLHRRAQAAESYAAKLQSIIGTLDHQVESGYEHGVQAGMVWGAAIIAMAEVLRINWGLPDRFVEGPTRGVYLTPNPVWKP